MTPADELRTAAQTLRKLADDATPGPWVRPLNTRYKSTVSAPLPEGERGSWLDGIDPTTGKRERCTVATVPTWSNGRHSRQRGGRDLEYIAALHPGVGTALADWLDQAAHHYECGIRAADDVFRDDPTGRDEFLTTGPGAPSLQALAVARQILGTTP
jgi:hypothetical protein